ncbi:hypothetical protein CWO07_20985 [Vibrio splendidus]|uniref:Uncharacterized protein n=1 Tax=Vibrio splendidus TaxID=29497 RepID=A0A2T5EQI2_VIBSP|nr:hypothetical protein CWO07_20985 [Vibrio splendidus]
MGISCPSITFSSGCKQCQYLNQVSVFLRHNFISKGCELTSPVVFDLYPQNSNLGNSLAHLLYSVSTASYHRMQPPILTEIHGH